MRFTSFDFVAVAFLILSVFSRPALVWSLRAINFTDGPPYDRLDVLSAVPPAYFTP
jgi:hypothetical protein